VLTALAALLVLFALVGPNQISHLTPTAFLRIPVEALVAVALLLVLPAPARRVAVVVLGVLLGLLTIVKFVDMGFYSVQNRPFDPALDWILFADALEYLKGSIGKIGATGAAIAAVLLAGSALVLMALAVRRLTRLAVGHRTATFRAVGVLAVAWIGLALLGVQVASSGASTLVYDRAALVRASIQDRETFAKEAAVDTFRDTPGSEMLTGLRGKDVLFGIVESYGRCAIEDPQMAPGVNAVLDKGTKDLAAAGFAARSGFLTSSVSGSGSWLAHATLLSGLKISNQQRYNALTSSDRTTITSAFKRANFDTVAVSPGTTRDWPEAKFYGYDRTYPVEALKYQGPNFSWSTMPDQYALSAFERFEHGKPGHQPFMAEIDLTSSHSPWSPIPKMVGWDEVGDGSIYESMAKRGPWPDVTWRSDAEVRADYARTIQYSLNSLISYVEKYGDDNTVLVFLGDHQPNPTVAGEHATRDVPITIVAKDHAVLDRIADWGWTDGLKPGPKAPVWPMESFRDRFLTAFGSTPSHPAR
jgi:hypothetical protein